MSDVVVNQLYRNSALQSSFGANMVALNGGKPQLMNLKDCLEAFLAYREIVVSRRTKFLLNKARDRAHVLVGLAVAVENVDEVIQTIRSSPDPATAKERLMAARLAGRPGRALHRADRRPAFPRRRGRYLPPVRPPGARHPRAAPAAPHRARPRGDHGRARDHRRRDPGLSRHPDEPPAHPHHHQGRADGRARRLRDAAPHRDPRFRRRHRGRGPHPARGHGRHRVPRRLRQARAALDLSGAAPRRQGPLRHVDQGRGFRHPPVRRLDARAGAVLLLARPGLQDEGLAPAAGGAPGARQGPRQPAAAAAGRAHHDHHAAARGRAELGRARRDVRNRRRHGPAQQALRLHPGQPQRQDRDEARRGRGHRRRRDLQRATTTCC